MAFEHAAGARQRACHGSRQGCDCRCRGVVGQGAQRAAAAGGRGVDSAALSRPEADPSGRPENMPPAVLVGRAAAALGHRGLTARQRVRAQQVIHYGFGAALGGAYLAAASRWPTVTHGRGALAGLAIYAGSHGSLLPALGVQRPPWRLAPAPVVWESMSHAVFRTALEA